MITNPKCDEINNSDNHDFIKQIDKSGGEVYMVGGAVRNILYNKIHNTKLSIKDRDLVVRGLGEESLIKCLEPLGHVDKVGQSFGVIKFKPLYMNESPDIDIALPRTEISTGSGHKDFQIVVDHMLVLTEDLKRRDATINAMAIRIRSKEDMFIETIDHKDVIDPHGGINDIKNLIWRAVDDPYKRFSEDPLRIMRAIRQCSELNMTLCDKQALIDSRDLIKVLMNESIVRITEELVRILASSYHHIINFLFESQIGNILELSDESLLHINKFTKENSNLRMRMCCLLMAHENVNTMAWIKKYNLSAAPHFPKNDIHFIRCLSFSYSLIPVILEEKDNWNKEILMKRLFQKLEIIRPGYELTYVSDLIKYYSIITGTDVSLLLDIYHRVMNMITSGTLLLSSSGIALNGNKIMELYKTYGSKIKILKNELFNLITEQMVENEEKALIQYVDKNLKHLL